jgi:ACS family allantoate permease-like MFS transporter
MDKQDDKLTVKQVDTARTQNFCFEQRMAKLKGINNAFLFTVDREPIRWNAEEECKLPWKINLRLIPLVCQVPSLH